MTKTKMVKVLKMLVKVGVVVALGVLVFHSKFALGLFIMWVISKGCTGTAYDDDHFLINPATGLDMNSCGVDACGNSFGCSNSNE